VKVLWYCIFGETVPQRYGKALAQALGFKDDELYRAIKEGLVREVGVGYECKSFFKWLRREGEVEKIIELLKEIQKQLGEQAKLLQELLKR